MTYSSKQLLRQQLSVRRNLVGPAEKILLDQNILRLFQYFISINNNFNKIALFWSLSNEINTGPIDDYLRSLNKRLLYPRIDQMFHQLTFHYINCTDEWETGPLNIMQPKLSCLRDNAELYVVPLLGYNLGGYRIGYGQGYYDRYFKKLRDIHCSFAAMGLAYTWQLVNYSFQEIFDHPLNYIITNIAINKFGDP